MLSVAYILIGGLFGLILLGVPVGFAIALISAFVLHFYAEMPLWLFLQRVFVGLDSFILVAIPFFLLTGNLMNYAGITDRLIRLSSALVGHIRGGLAHINVLVSMFFGGISGSSTADTAGVGSVLIPAMQRRGYSSEFSVAVTAASSTLGSIIPPSILMIVYASTTGTSVAAMFLGGVIPGIVIGVGMMALSYVFALRYNYPAEERKTWAEIWASIKDALLPLVTPLIIIGGVVGGIFTATEASVIAVLYSLFLGLFVYRSIKFTDLPAILLDTAKLSSLSLFCIGGATIFGWLLAFFQVPSVVSAGILGVTEAPMMILLLIIGVFLLVGTFMDAVPAILILMPVLQPVAEGVGVHPVALGVLVVIALAYGLITPPYGLCLLIASSIAKIPVHRGLPMTMVFLAFITVILLLIMVFPDVILFLPRLLVPDYL